MDPALSDDVVGRYSLAIDGAIVAKFQEAEIDYLLNSESGSRTIAENYVGLPLDFGQRA